MNRLFSYRLLGAAMLDHSMYEGIEADREVLLQAAATVLMSSLACGIGATAWLEGGVLLLVAVTIIAIATWIAWAVLILQIGSRILPGPETHVDLGELLRTTGFATAPLMLQLLEVIRPIAVPVFVLTTIWMFVAMVVAVRHALDYQSSWKALGVCGLAAALWVGFMVGFSLLYPQPAS
jgi:hypothetical protein